MFLGSFEHCIDAKGRVNFPSRFREVLSGQSDGRIVLTTNIDDFGACIVVYPFTEWLVFQEKIASLPQFDPAVVRLKRLHIAGATECSFDKQGRIMVSSMHRDYAALSGTIVFAGLGSSIEIWNKDA